MDGVAHCFDAVARMMEIGTCMEHETYTTVSLKINSKQGHTGCFLEQSTEFIADCSSVMWKFWITGCLVWSGIWWPKILSTFDCRAIIFSPLV